MARNREKDGKIKRRLYYWAKEKVISDNIKFYLLLIPLTVVLVKSIMSNGLDFSDFLDTDILVSFILVALCDNIAKWIQGYIQKKCEDSAKLTNDYAALVKKYSCDSLIEYGKNNKFPVICLCARTRKEKWDIQVCDSTEEFYELPSQAADFSQELMNAHKQSVLYNQINIRLNGVDYDAEKRSITLHTGRTYYFDSMITNRACDYLLSNGKTIREIFEPGPYIRPLSMSKMSNHLGFNGFVMTKDGKIPFIKRSDNLSIGKNTLANSIGASMKTKYAVGCHSEMAVTKKSLGHAILCEIQDELALKKIDVTEEEAADSIFAFYRDLVECGKPQFLFFLNLDISSQELQKNFGNANGKKNTNEQDKVLRDGKEMLFFDIEQIKNATITAGDITFLTGEGSVCYQMMPSASASVVMLLDFLCGTE